MSRLLLVLVLAACTGPDGGVDSDSDSDSPDCADPLTLWVDADRDGFGGEEVEVCTRTSGLTDVSGDCDDDDPGTHPEAPETCEPLDRDCDGDPFAGASDAFVSFIDADGDGHAGTPLDPACELAAGASRTRDDCDDEDPAVHPGAVELCDLIDQDCDRKLGFDEMVGLPGDTVDAAIRAAPEGGRVCVLAGTWELSSTFSDTFVSVYGEGRDKTVLVGDERMLDLTGGHLAFHDVRLDPAEAEQGAVARVVGGSLGLYRVDVDVLVGSGSVSGLLVHGEQADILLEDVHVEGLRMDEAHIVDGAVLQLLGGTLQTDGFSIHDATGPTGGYSVLGSGLIDLDGVAGTLAGLDIQDVSFRVGPRTPGGLGVMHLDRSDVEIRDATLSNIWDPARRTPMFRQRWGHTMLERVRVEDVHGSGFALSWGSLEASEVTWERVEGMVLYAYDGDAQLSQWDQLYGGQGCGVLDTWDVLWHIQGAVTVDADRVRNIGNTMCANELYAISHRGKITIRNLISAGNDLQVWPGDVRPRSRYWVRGGLSAEGGGLSTFEVENAVYLDEIIDPELDALLIAGPNTSMIVRNTHFGPAWSATGLPLVDYEDRGDAVLQNLTFEGRDFDVALEDDSGSTLVGDLSFWVAPRFVDRSATDPFDWDLRLDTGSPLIDAGHPSVLDADGSVSDIGAHGGPLGARW